MDKKITIGLFNDSFYPMSDGVISVIDNYARRLSKVANVIVFVPRYHGSDIDYKSYPYKIVHAYSLKTPFFPYPLPLPKLDKGFMERLDEYDLDIVHVHSPATMGIAGIKYAKKHHIPCIITMHTQTKQDFKRAFKSDKMAEFANDKLMMVYNACDEAWAVNKNVADLFYKEYHVKKYPRIMNNATEMVPVEKDEACNEINNKYNLDDEERVFLFVGRLNILKNILFIVDALKELDKLNPKFKYKMLFVGDGPDKRKLIHYIKELEMEDKIILCGKVTDRAYLANYFARADLFLFPSLYDSSSIVQIEAASQMTPALFLEDSVTSGTITNEVDGYIVPFDAQVYAKKIIDILSNEEEYKHVCENAYKNLYHNWDDTIDEVYNIYLDLIEKKEKENENKRSKNKRRRKRV